jgi:hypothetical protein
LERAQAARRGKWHGRCPSARPRGRA